jgi:hypothetical protein
MDEDGIRKYICFLAQGWRIHSSKNVTPINHKNDQWWLIYFMFKLCKLQWTRSGSCLRTTLGLLWYEAVAAQERCRNIRNNSCSSIRWQSWLEINLKMTLYIHISFVSNLKWKQLKLPFDLQQGLGNGDHVNKIKHIGGEDPRRLEKRDVAQSGRLRREGLQRSCQRSPAVPTKRVANFWDDGAGVDAFC